MAPSQQPVPPSCLSLPEACPSQKPVPPRGLPTQACPQAAAGPSRSEHWRRSPNPLARSAKAMPSPRASPRAQARSRGAQPAIRPLPAACPLNLPLPAHTACPQSAVLTAYTACPRTAESSASTSRDKAVDNSLGLLQLGEIKPATILVGAPTGHGIPARGATPGMGVWKDCVL